MEQYFINPEGKDTFSIKEAKTRVEKLNKMSSKFGVRYIIKRLNLTTAKIVKEKVEGGIEKSKRKTFKKRRGGC